jgi:hypothetical protein
VSQLAHTIVLLIGAGLLVILVQHGWGGVKAKASAVFLGKARPDLVR